jgi:2-polyprenyl-6-methoxyphenol hydroxylase-like FAD-dependent oxidoreductase
MKNVAVIGAGPVGLTTAMLLAREGLSVTVLEKDPQPAPATAAGAWTAWERPGVAQFRQTHFMQPRFLHLLDKELPAVRDAIVALGGRRFSPLTTLPLPLRAAIQGDDRFETLTARRPVLEAAFAQVACETPGITIRRGVRVRSLLPGRSASGSIPHAAGVLTAAGDRIHADLVVDAGGRRSKFTEWVQALAGPPPIDEASDAGFAYYTRHFRSRSGRLPGYRGPMAVFSGSVGVTVVVADNATWNVAVLALAGDQPLKGLRHAPVWEAVARSFPTVAHWIEGEPISGVMPMAGVLDRRRRFVIEGAPVATGVIPVGDAWACTNPTAGRGFSLGIWQAALLRDTARRHPDDPASLVEDYASETERLLTPWYQDQHDRDRHRARRFRTQLEGRSPAHDPAQSMELALLNASRDDPHAARGWLDVFGCIALLDGGARPSGDAGPRVALPGPTAAAIGGSDARGTPGPSGCHFPPGRARRMKSRARLPARRRPSCSANLSTIMRLLLPALSRTGVISGLGGSERQRE